MWTKMERVYDNVDVIIYYDHHDKLSPLSEYLHPGMLPIGDPIGNDSNHNLPNLDWIIRQLMWSGITNFHIISPIPIRGLDKYYINQIPEITISFHEVSLIDFLLSKPKLKEHTLIKNALFFSNGNYRELIETHINNNHINSLIVFKGLKYQVGLVEVDRDTNLVNSFREKPIDRSVFVNTNELILNNNDFLNILNGSAIDDSLRNDFIGIIKLIIRDDKLMRIELNSVNQSLITLNLDSIESWRKLDINGFFEMYAFLIENQSI